MQQDIYTGPAPGHSPVIPDQLARATAGEIIAATVRILYAYYGWNATGNHVWDRHG